MSELNGFVVFTSLDLTGAYLELALDEESIPLTTINTHLGLYQYLRMPFGIKSAPAISQSVIDKILHGLPGVFTYFDDILIGGKTVEECVERTRQVLKRLQEFNVNVNFSKCQLFVERLEYLGHEVSAQNLQSHLRPIHDLLKKEVKFFWSIECQKAFDLVKSEIAKGPLLVHFDPSKELTMVCDASPYGVGAVLNVVIDGIERPCLMTSSSLSVA